MRGVIYGIIAGIFLTSMAGIAYPRFMYYGPTLETEHLYRIALSVRQNSSVTIQQAMVAILRANPQAFNQNNINGLKSGYRLRIPPAYIMMQIPPEQALQTVKHQNFSWSQEPISRPLSTPRLKKIGKEQVEPTPRHSNTLAKLTKKKKHTEKKYSEQSTADSIASIENASESNKSKNDLPATTVTPAKSTITDFSTSAGQKTASSQEETANNLSNTPSNNVLTFINETKTFKEQVNERLSNLEKQNKSLETKVNQLDETFKTMAYHLIQNSASNQKGFSWNQLKTSFKQHALNLMIGISVLIILIIVWLVSRRSSKNKRNHFNYTPSNKPTNETENNKKDEYDYMNSHESIPTKLDLARAYIDMGDTGSAETVLKEVLEKGSSENKKAANDLLSQLNQ